MHLVTSLALLVALQQPGASQQPAVWTIDPAHSAAHFAVRHLMVSTVRGQLGKISGTILYDGRSIESIAAEVTIDVTAINTGTADRDADLRSPNFFDAATHPTMSFKSRRAEPAGPGHFRLIGDLTMHGVTREVALDVEGPSPPIRQRGSERVGASASAHIDRRDWGLTWNRAIEAGGVMVGELVHITIDLEATRKIGTTQ